MRRSTRASNGSAISMAGCSRESCAVASPRRRLPPRWWRAPQCRVFVGTDFFPRVDAGLIQLHVRAPARTRIERTEQIFAAIEDNIRKQIPAKDLGLVLDNIGLPQRTYNLAFTDGSTIGVNDGQIKMQLTEGHQPTARYIQTLRQRLAADFPDVPFYFQPADLVTQVLNFGVPSQVDVRVQGRDRENNKRIAAVLQQRIGDIPGIVDAHVQQELDAPESNIRSTGRAPRNWG